MANSRKKRIILILIVIMIAHLVAFIIYQLIPAYIEYDVDINSIREVNPDEINAMTITFRKWGRPSSLHLTLKFTNASFSNQTEQPYIQTNSTTVQLPNLSGYKTVYYTVDNNVTGFSVKFFHASSDLNLQVMKWMSWLSFNWNETSKSYEPSQFIVGVV
jgi:hypothetical protein